MSRDLVLCVLSLAVCGMVTVAVAALPFGGQSIAPDRSASNAEVRAWLRLWSPLVPSLLALAALLGWAGQEPAQTDELLRPIAFGLALPPALLLLRAASRALRSLVRGNVDLPAATIGLWRPRVLVSPMFRERLDEPALAAVLAHERAHARHRDPLRVWLAQIATDLQWPSRGAERRQQHWHHALELARDEEARREGTRGEDLAAAIICASKLRSPRAGSAVAALTTPEIDLSARVRRLLDPLPASASRRRLFVMAIVIAGAVAACAAGLHFGDLLVRALPIVVS